MKTETFAKETDLCAAFVESLPKGWRAYAETGGFDLLLVRGADGFQIGIEAKLRLNAKVIAQCVEKLDPYRVAGPNPDCRAVLVPYGVSLDFGPVCSALGLTVVRVHYEAERWRSSRFYPILPSIGDGWNDAEWYERCPVKRVTVPDYVPDVPAGDKSPISLTPWKVKAIKIVITLEKRGYVTRQDFKHFQIHMSRWIDPYARWLVKDGDGGWIAGPYLPDLRSQHPVNYVQIEGDYEKWKSPAPTTQRGLFAGTAA